MRSAHRRIRKTIAAVCGLIVLSPLCVSASVLPPEPNNAALLYYQALVVCPEPDDTTKEVLNKVLSGAEPNGVIKKYMKDSEQAIRLVEAAVMIPACDWGIAYSLGQGPSTEVLIRLRRLAYALSADARIHASARDYRAALNRCVLMCRVAHHGATRYADPPAINIESIAYGAMEHVLGVMPPETETLTWLKHELASLPTTLPSFVQTVRSELELTLQDARTNNKTLPWLKGELLKQADDSTRPALQQMTDDELIDLARKPCSEFLHKAEQAVNGNLPYGQVYGELARLVKEVDEHAKSNPAIFLSLKIDMKQIVRQYAWRVHRQARLNAFQVALNLYIEAARTGRLPRRLPENQPSDPLTGDDFDYEITKGGFVLRNQHVDIPGDGIHAFEFKVCDPSLLKAREPWEMAIRPTGSTRVAPKIAPAEPNGTEGAQVSQAGGERAKVPYEKANDLAAIILDESLPSDVRTRAEAARTRLKTRTAKGLATPEPILIRASLCRTNGGGTALNVVAVDHDHDTAGLRIKEAHVDSDGRISSVVEDYPAYINRYTPWQFEEAPLLPVMIRDKEQKKDYAAWQAYLIDCYDLLVQRRSDGRASPRPYGLDMPSIWISRPEPGRVRVFACLYDRQRHESEYIEVEDLLNEKPIDPLTYMLMLQSWLEKQSR